MKSGGDVAAARACYERAVEELGEDANNEELFLRFAEFEERVKEVDRARWVARAACWWGSGAAGQCWVHSCRGNESGVAAAAAAACLLHSVCWC